MLQYLKQSEQWDYRHRDVATPSELSYFLTSEWKNCRKDSILYLTTHGSPGCITLSSDTDVYLTEMWREKKAPKIEDIDLAKILEDSCEGRHVHFGGCAVMGCWKEWIWDFLRVTGATVVSGFTDNSIGWSDLKKPGVLAEVMLFSALSGVKYSDGRNFKSRFRSIEEQMNDRFEDCGFTFKFGDDA